MLVVGVYTGDDLLDQLGFGPSNHVVEEYRKVILVNVLDGREEVSLDKLRGTLEILQVVLERRHLKIENVD